MSSRAITLTVAVFILIIAGMFGYAYLKKSEVAYQDEPAENEQPTETPGPYAGIERVDAKHWFIDGTHTLAGEIPMPTPCDLLETSATVAESYPEQVIIDFSVINTADTCAQVVTPQRFKVSFDASEDASISARLQGRDIELNIIPPAEGETPDDFELFIKG